MKQSIAIIDYGIGNIKSIINAFTEIGCHAELVGEPEQVSSFDKIVFPGVGAFGNAMEKLASDGMAEALNEAKESGKMILGICLGMQLMCLNSTEDGDHQGLGWVDASVTRFIAETPDFKIPHIGWNSIHIERENGLLRDVVDMSDVYFVHSYKVKCQNSDDIVATCEYGERFVAIFGKENLYGIQFHPEKSQWVGLKILSNFLEI